MANDKINLITHPMRAQIITALTGRPLTIAQLAAILPEIPLPSLYRHVRLLVEGEILEAVDEVRVNGAPTRVYGVRPKQVMITPEDTLNTPAADHLVFFSAFTDMLNAQFRNYVTREDAAPRTDLVSAVLTVLYLAPDEYDRFKGEIGEVVRRWAERPRPENGQRHLLSNIVFPDKSEPPPA
ncbi:MAG: helix-turn-helix domain-containing protein [Capsulimonadales bacterium]|nr:helix-turn-helix domain-containing protein [Capsulimonadales bacterium]